MLFSPNRAAATQRARDTQAQRGMSVVTVLDPRADLAYGSMKKRPDGVWTIRAMPRKNSFVTTSSFSDTWVSTDEQRLDVYCTTVIAASARAMGKGLE